ncbi:hypothetical protein N7931_05415 [Catenovulum sp. 2E275]|uniref:hypothetical protein n=1 Tax=Catenovulum sp. 2E275 TaxID=2980497 RepID=UPI0021D181D8|nr:hypothetical protein [Catenovulum sp. 2E275]MCU4675066.1 hypothetical protein [Catenovulum sp. 2E275]
MHLKYKSIHTGSTLVTSLFIIVFMAVLLAGILRTISIGGSNISYEVIGQRALLSAKAGLEVGLSRLYPLDSTASTDCATITASTVNLPQQKSFFSGCTVSLSCETRSGVNNGGDLFIISAIGQCTAAELTTSRRLIIEAVGL